MVSRNLRFRFTLVSYNILSQTLLNDHRYIYNECNSRDLEWPRRGHKIVSELLNNQADIICLQEVESEHLQSLYRPRLAHFGYECLYKKKTGHKIDGCAIFYKSNLFNLLKYRGVEFNRTDVAHLLNRDNVGIIAVLQPRPITKSRSSHLVIANTHLLFNPRRCDVKLAQLKFFLSQLEEISLDHKNSSANERCHYPTILCGDLNSTPDSTVTKYILKQIDKNINNNNNSQIDICQQNLNDGTTGQDTQAPNMETLSALRLNFKQFTLNKQNNINDNLNDCANISESYQSQSIDDNVQRRKDNSPSPTTTPTTSCQHLNDSLQSDSYGQSSSSSGCLTQNNLSDDQSELSRFEHSLKFKSVYPNQNLEGRKYISTFSGQIVDYIYFTHTKLRLDSFRELLTQEELSEVGPLPNSEFPSDHIALEAKFILK